MSKQLESMQTPAGVVEQFRAIKDRFALPPVNPGFAHNVLYGFFQRICNGPTLEALCEVTAIEPDLASIMTQFLEHIIAVGCRNREIVTKHILRLLKAMEIQSPFLEQSVGRIFVWLERGDRMAAENKVKAVGKVKEITGRASRKDFHEQEGPLDNPKATLHIYEYKRDVSGIVLDAWAWELRHGKDSVTGEAFDREDAATKVYKAFYRNSTMLKFNHALIPRGGINIVLLGNWITKEELDSCKRKDMLTHVSDAHTDERDDSRMFVLGFPSVTKEKVVVKARQVMKRSKVGQDDINTQNHILVLESGLKLEGSLDWYVYKPELQVSGEVMCPQCESVGSINHMNMCFVRGYGPRCGPCIERMIEEQNLDEGLVDMQALA